MRFSRLAAIAGASVLVLGIASCSSTGGKPEETGGGMGAGQANTPRATVAMITHEVPGDSFWDLIRKGAQAAADKDNIELRYSNDPEAPNQANLVQTAIDSGVEGIALTLAKPDAMAPAVKAALTRTFRSSPSTRASTTGRRWAYRSTSARTRSSPASPRANVCRRTAPRRSSA